MDRRTDHTRPPNPGTAPDSGPDPEPVPDPGPEPGLQAEPDLQPAPPEPGLRPPEPVTLPAAADPYPAYRALREAGPVHLVREPTGLSRYTVVHHEHARALLTDDRISKDPRNAWEALLAAGYATGEEETDRYLFHIANTDPPDHTRLRSLVQKAFGVGRVERLRPFAVQTAHTLLDRLPPDPVVDLVEHYAWPLTVSVLAELLGVPGVDYANYRTWATAMLVPPGDPRAPMSRPEAYRHITGFFADLLAARRAQGVPDGDAPDLLTALLYARDGEDRLAEEELVALAIFLVNTGQEPTVNLIGNGVLALLRHPDQLSLLRSQPEALGHAIEEFLRYEAPVAASSLRIAMADIDVGGTTIPRGGIVSVLFGSANRDGDRYPDADALDILRADPGHLAFGHGIHRCLGAPLGRMIAEAGIGTLLQRCEDIALGCPAEELTWRITRVTRGLDRLPLVLAPRPARG